MTKEKNRQQQKRERKGNRSGVTYIGLWEKNRNSEKKEEASLSVTPDQGRTREKNPRLNKIDSVSGSEKSYKGK